MPTEKYARAKELLAHSRMIGEKFDLYSRALFQTEVKDMRWNEDSGRWITTTSRGDKIKSRFIIPAAGPLHRPKLPGLEGIEDFKGHSFHSSRWDFNYTGGDPAGNLHKLKDKRVGIIGTGATAVQIVPHLGEWAKQLYVFQRTPSSVDVRNNSPTDTEWAQSLEPGWQKKRMDNFDSVVNGGIEEVDMVADGWTDIIRELITKKIDTSDPVAAAAQRQLADFQKMEQVRTRCDTIVHDKATADALKPWYNQFCKRPCFHDEYLQTFNRPNVTLVDTKGQGVSRITPNGVVANGQEYEVDCLIYATGFELANEWSHKTGIEIYGRDGLTISEKWREGAATLHGWTSRGFPNCFWVQVVQAALTPNFMHVTAEQAKHFAYVIAECNKRGIRTVEPTAEAEADWCKTIVEGTAIRADFFKECTPGYYNNEGKPSLVAARNATYGHGSPAFLKILTEWREKGDLAGLDARYFSKEEGALEVNGRTEGALEEETTNQVEEEATNQVEDEATNKVEEKETNKAEEEGVTKEVASQANGTSQSVAADDEPASLMQMYTDLQAKHQAELSELLGRQKREVEGLLARHVRKDSVAEGVNGVH